MFEALRKFGIAAAIGTMVLAGAVAGCGSMSSNHVDCNVVKLQQQSGRSDSEIAAAIGASVSDVSSCAAGPAKSGNKSSGGVPDSY
ncbi:MAG: hypothetical protein Q7S58_12280 [Candidatus Binatus sp.]|uniref:hypothetical protein n=1 Tax=Candidatus Binatus sp. TaxID=2811406 RepID=UPI002723702C|nr:hypothetical protein [Candidatus Binatus sp.]MDO8433177.1 hypothetical protein [Candidatus Binatus sp.]